MPMSSLLHTHREHRQADKGVHSTPVMKLSASLIPVKVVPNLYYMQKSVLSSSAVIQLVLKLFSYKIEDYLNSGLYHFFHC